MKEKIDSIFRLLGCTNADIARILDCSPTLISRIRSESREYTPVSRPVTRFIDGLYRYADSKNNIKLLCGLCGAESEDREEVISMLTAWLFELDKRHLSQSKKEIQRRSRAFFGEKLDNVMDLLELSNTRLAKKINVDASVVSRFRNGLRCPKPPISDALSETLLERAKKQDKLKELCRLCGFHEGSLPGDPAAFSAWLYNTDSTLNVSDIDNLLGNIEQFPQNDSPIIKKDIHDFATNDILNSDKSLYWGEDGLREAVIRFLGTAARDGGSLWLYSDQDMKWMLTPPEYQKIWKMLMIACTQAGISIKIIHNIDRDISEMLSAIQSWLPLYMSGMIEPYFCLSKQDSRFSKTLFLRPGAACILSSLLRGNEDNGWYEYITNKAKLEAVAADFNGLLANSSPLIKIFFDNYRSPFQTNADDKNLYMLLSTLSLGTMPKALLSNILTRNSIGAAERVKIEEAHEFYQNEINHFMKDRKVVELLALPSDEELFAGTVRVNLSQSLCDTNLFYTPEEYAAHIRAVRELIKTNMNYELILLPELPFVRLQMTVTESRCTVLRDQNPCSIFLFSESRMAQSFFEYLTLLKKQYPTDRNTARQKLLRFL